jgi:phage FluMu gp28-like protein
MHSTDLLHLLPYQADFAANTARFKIGLWARQTGKDHTATAEAVLDCLHNPGTTWIIVAAGERQALESLAKAKEWAAFLKFQIADYTEAPGNVPYAVARAASTEIKWSNGSRLIALPANASTIRGYSANLILTEFAFHENPDAIWRAIYPTISNPLRGGVKKLRIISTPNGLNNKFAHLWHSHNLTLNPNPNLNPSSSITGGARSTVPHFNNNQSVPFASEGNLQSKISNLQSPLFHTSRITIHDAIRDGLPLDSAELQAGLNDPEAWAQEYLCEFMDNSSVLLPYDLIESCESSFATEGSTLESLSASALPGNGRPQLFAGIDFARKNHLTVCWILERLPLTPNLNLSLGGTSSMSPSSPIPNNQFSIFDSQSQSSLMPNAHCSIPNAQWNPSSSAISAPSALFLTREVLCLQNASTPDQLALLLPRLRLCQRVCLDYTGPGIGLGDFLHRELNNSISSPHLIGRGPLNNSVPSPHQMGRGPGRGDRLELCTFTAPFKAELFPRLAAAFESRELLIPIGRDIREDLHSIYRTVTNSGTVLYRAHSTPDGHADRTTALALALRAAQSAVHHPGGCSTVGRKYRICGGPARNSYSPPERTLAILY